MRPFIPAFLLLLVFTIPASVQAKEESSISVKAEVDKATFTIGEKVEYRVSVTHDPALQVTSQIPPPPAESFQVKEVHDFSEKQGRQIVEGRRFLFTTYELGEYILEPVILRYRTPGGEEKTIQTNKLYLSVRSVDTSGKPKTDIRDVKGTLNLKGQGGWVAALFLALLAGGGAFAWWQVRRRNFQAEGEEEPALSLEDETLLQLNRLFDSDLLRRGKLKEYFLTLSEILRRYFEKRFDILAIESTTLEVVRDLTQREIPTALLEKIRQVLETADLVKFAKWKPAPTEILKANQLAKTIVEEARPQVGV